MKAYLATTGSLFALLFLVHLWLLLADWRRLATDPGFVVEAVIGAIAGVLSVWA